MKKRTCVIGYTKGIRRLEQFCRDQNNSQDLRSQALELIKNRLREARTRHLVINAIGVTEFNSALAL